MTTVADMPVLDRRVDACACPDCGMPMSIRMWLRTADCLRCGTSIALDFLPQADLAPDPAKLFAAEPQETLDVDFDITPPPVISAAERFWRSLHRLLSCLFSIIAHLLLLLLLAFITWGAGSQEDRTINLSVEFDKNERDGGVLVDEQIETVGFQLPVEPKKSKQEIEADQWAKQLAVEDGKSAPNLPPLERVEQALESDDPYRRMLSARDPRIRKQIIKQEGGTNRTEAAVARALDWMARHQARDGSWSLHEFHRAGDCRGRCRNRGHMQSDEGATAMALMAMLGAGQTHRTGIYRDEVSHGLQFLLARQDREGGLIGGSAHQAGMYSHGLATIALCDAYAMTGDSTLREPAQQALNYLMAAQHREGGWRYEPGERGDLSVTGWQLMALHSGRAAGLDFDPEVFGRASEFLDEVQSQRDGSQYAYQFRHGPSAAMTAEGLLSRLYLGWKQDEPGLQRGIDYLQQRHPIQINRPNIYYWYYGTQLMHHWGGREWDNWNRVMADALVTTQVRAGHAAGSWDPDTPHGGAGGRLYMTALATCILEVYYRHAPLFRRIDLRN